MPPLAQTISKLPPRGKAVLAGSVLATLVVAFLLFKLVAAPSYAILSSGLDPAETGKITAALDEKGISYELRSNGTALAVEKAQVAQARIALAEQGLAGDSRGKEGFELFDKQKLGASDFQQKVAYQRALEGEVARTIQQVKGVSGAQVQLVLPEEELFADAESKASAAVLLAGSADSLEPGAVRGIAQLVASSVKGLRTDDVTITDGTGQLLWPSDEAGAGGAGGATAKQAAESRYERALEANLVAMLAQTLGPGKAQVQVKADLNVDEATRDELRYAREGVPLKSVEEEEELEGGGAGAAGPAGTAGNVPGYAQGAAGGAGSNYQRRSESTEFGVNKEVTRTKVAPGQVEKLDVALMLDESVPAAARAGIRDAVASAAGVDDERGDTLSLTALRFAATTPPEEKKPMGAGVLGWLKWIALGLGTLVFLFFVGRHLRRREQEALTAEPEWLREITRPTPIAELERAPERQQATQVLPELPDRQVDPDVHRLDQLMDREPDRVAAQVRQWMMED